MAEPIDRARVWQLLDQGLTQEQVCQATGYSAVVVAVLARGKLYVGPTVKPGSHWAKAAFSRGMEDQYIDAMRDRYGGDW